MQKASGFTHLGENLTVSPKGKNYKPEYAFELLSIAQGDLDSAKGLARIQEGRLENICYLAQQCAEKCLKATLCYFGKMVFHTHDLDALVSHLPENLSPPRSHQIGALTEFSMIRRYEEGYEILTIDDIRMAIDIAQEILDWAKSICQKK